MKNTFYSFLILLIAIPLYAEEVDKENFDRLFTSHAERQKLDSLRKNGLLYKKPNSDTIGENENKLVAKPRELKVSGIVLRADGKAQVWLSGQPLYSSLKQLNSTKNTSSDLRVPLPGKNVMAKPGQVLLNGKVKESYLFVETTSSVVSTNYTSSLSSISDVNMSSASSVSSSQGGNHAQSSAR